MRHVTVCGFEPVFFTDGSGANPWDRLPPVLLEAEPVPVQQRPLVVERVDPAEIMPEPQGDAGQFQAAATAAGIRDGFVALGVRDVAAHGGKRMPH